MAYNYGRSKNKYTIKPKAAWMGNREKIKMHCVWIKLKISAQLFFKLRPKVSLVRLKSCPCYVNATSILRIRTFFEV